MKKPVVVAGIKREDMRAQRVLERTIRNVAKKIVRSKTWRLSK